jgi:hypothetical protein
MSGYRVVLKEMDQPELPEVQSGYFITFAALFLTGLAYWSANDRNFYGR